jgi:redox-sensitive bicupin YhaK (pirin superfamily)
MTPTIQIKRAGERFHTRIDWLDSWHSFSFGGHYDPDEVGHGLLLVNNDDRVAPANGFGMHPHRDMEIVTWVLDGAVEHHDTSGGAGVITPGQAQRMSAGTGVRHSEVNPSATEPVHFVQMWVMPAVNGVAPSYEQVDVSAALEAGDLVHVAGGTGRGRAVTINQPGADLWAVRLAPGASVDLPTREHTHVFAAIGRAEVGLDGGEPVALGPGDALRLTGVERGSLTGGDGGAEVLVWATV